MANELRILIFFEAKQNCLSLRVKKAQQQTRKETKKQETWIAIIILSLNSFSKGNQGHSTLYRNSDDCKRKLNKCTYHSQQQMSYSQRKTLSCRGER